MVDIKLCEADFSRLPDSNCPPPIICEINHKIEIAMKMCILILSIRPTEKESNAVCTFPLMKKNLVAET